MSYTDSNGIKFAPTSTKTITKLDKVGASKIETGNYNVEPITDSKYQDYVLESIIPAAADIIKKGTDTDATFKIKVTPRAGKLPPNGKLYFKLTSAYEGNEDISFNGTVHLDDETNTFVPNTSGMPYVAGWRGDGLVDSGAVAEITSSGATLEVGIFGYNIGVSGINDKTASTMINYIKAISVEYAWVDEAV